MKYFFIGLLFLLLVGCTSTTEKPRPSDWQGSWSARWETPPEAYPGIEDMEFTMTGIFEFTSDSLTVQANGFDNCIFGTDTLTHTQSWYIVKNVQNEDSLLISFNDSEQAGLAYQVKSKTENKIMLQVVNDINITLSKQ